MEDFNTCLKAMSDGTRLSILELLLRYGFCASALSKRLGISEAAISQHIKVLKDADLLSYKKEGYFMQYEVNVAKLREISSYLISMTAVERLPCDPTLENCPPKKRCLCHSEKRCKGCDCCKDCRKCHRTIEELAADNMSA